MKCINIAFIKNSNKFATMLQIYFMKIFYLFFFFLIFIPCLVCGQSTIVEGVVLNSEGEQLPGATVRLNQTEFVTISDQEGYFKFKGVTPGTYQLITTFVGYQLVNQDISLNKGEKLNLKIILHQSSEQLDEIQVISQSESTILKESSAAVSLLQASDFHHRSTNTTELIGTISGVQVRQNGGFGNQADIAIQGLSGRQVKLFIDGIPLDFLYPLEELGLGAALATLPVNLLERIEVYKGVLPGFLGADALGGAVNMVSRENLKDYLDFSLQHSSFNTWQTTLNTRKVTPSGFTIGLNGLFAFAENNYRLDDVQIINDFGNPSSISAPKFHDAFRSYLIQGDIGLLNKSWTDKILLKFSHAYMYDEIQHNFEMRQPYGQALLQADVFNTALVYEKYDYQDRLDIQFYLGYNRSNSQFVDTTHNIYNWRGEIIGQKNYGGEITTSQNNLNLHADNISSRINLNYRLKPNTKLTFNGVNSFFRRTGNDPVAETYYGDNFFETPVHIFKSVWALGVENSLFKQKLNSSTYFKAYGLHSEGFKIEDGLTNTFSQNLWQWGFSQAFKWQIKPGTSSKLSYEYATRLPDRIEFLGDFSQAIDASPRLKPETSHNLNLGMFSRMGALTLEVNTFARFVRDIIILQAVPPPVLSSYDNLLKTRILGIEAELKLKPWQWLSLRTNATYQDLRNRSNKLNAGVSSDRYFGARLPNRPYFFGNAEILAHKDGLFSQQDKLQGWWTVNFVQKYFRYWEIDGRQEDKLVIPSQWTHHIGLSYRFWEEKLNLSLEIQNIFDALRYDNFRVQKPGRSFHIKIQTFLNTH